MQILFYRINKILLLTFGIFLLTFVLIGDIYSQSFPDIQISKFYQTNPPSSIDEFIGADDTMAYFVNSDSRPLIFTYYLMQVHLDSLTVKSIDLSYSHDGNKLLFKGALYVDGKLFCFYSGKQKLKGILYAVEVDRDYLILSSKPIPIISTNITANTKFIFEVSPDKKKFAIITQEAPNYNSKKLSYVYSFDADLNNLFAVNPIKDLPKNQTVLRDYKIDNSGRIDLLIELRKNNQLVLDPTLDKFLVASFGNGDSAFSVWDIGNSTDVILQMGMDINSEGKLFVTGFYGGEEHWGLGEELFGYAGVISEIINPNTKEILLKNKYPFSADLLEDLSTDIHKDQLYDYHLVEIHVTENGDQALVCEKFFGKLIVIGLNTEGEIKWYQTAGKSQVLNHEPKPYIYTSLKSYIINNNVIVIYNNNENFSLMPMQLKLLSIDISSGKSKIFELFDSDKTTTNFVVKESGLFNERNVFLYSQKNTAIPGSFKIAVLKF